MMEILQQLSDFIIQILSFIDHIWVAIWDWACVEDSYYESLMRMTILLFFYWVFLFQFFNFAFSKDVIKGFKKIKTKEEKLIFIGKKSNNRILIITSLFCAYISANFATMFIFNFWGINGNYDFWTHYWMCMLQIMPAIFLPMLIICFVSIEYWNEKLFITDNFIYYAGTKVKNILNYKDLDKSNISDIEKIELNPNNKKGIVKKEFIFHYKNGEKKSYYSYMTTKTVNSINNIIKG